MILGKENKVQCYFWYILSAFVFEGSISVLLGLIGLIFFDTTPYYYLTSALLGGIWSYRFVHIYDTIGKMWRAPDAEEYFLISIWNAEGHKLRRYLSFCLAIVDGILLIALYYPIII